MNHDSNRSKSHGIKEGQVSPSIARVPKTGTSAPTAPAGGEPAQKPQGSGKTPR
jgi:hypothetical protein